MLFAPAKVIAGGIEVGDFALTKTPQPFVIQIIAEVEIGN